MTLDGTLVRELVMDGLSERSAKLLTSISALVRFLFGDGHDGDASLSASSTTLTRSMSYHNLEIPASKTLVVPSGLTVQVAGALTGGGFIIADGQGSAGGAGATGGGATGTAGAAYGNAAGGAGGAGGHGTPGAAGAASTVTQNGKSGLLAILTNTGKGAGGSGGGGDGTNAGGAGGAGGGDLRIFARSLSQWAGEITSKGLAGAAAAAGNAGGGGGGGGGVIDLFSADELPPGFAYSVNGGAGGALHGTGAAGAAGGVGLLRHTQIG